MKIAEDRKHNKYYDTIYVKKARANYFYDEYLVAYWDKSVPYVWDWQSMNEAGDKWVIVEIKGTYYEAPSDLDPTLPINRLHSVPSKGIRFLGKVFKKHIYNKYISAKFSV